jgi:hypothetical protein
MSEHETELKDIEPQVENTNEDTTIEMEQPNNMIPPLDLEKKNSGDDLAIETPLKYVQTSARLYNQNPIQIAWKDLNYTVKVGKPWKKFDKVILNPMTGNHQQTILTKSRICCSWSSFGCYGSFWKWKNFIIEHFGSTCEKNFRKYHHQWRRSE